MKNYNRIFWEKGLDITPEILIESDNYNAQQHNIIRKISTLQSYGILPESKFLIKPTINNDILSIHISNCSAITSHGYLININNHIALKEIKLYECTNEDHYIILRVQPYDIESAGENTPYAQPKYDVEIKEARKEIEDGIPILKISRINKCWEIDADYIPPSVSICSNENLTAKYAKITDKIIEISGKLLDDNYTSLQIKLLEIELKNYSLYESPFELVNTLKKIMAIIELYFQKTLNINDLIQAKEFIEKKYSHNEIAIILAFCMECLDVINQKLDEKPEPTEEKPEPTEEELLNI